MLLISTVTLAEGRELYERAMRGEEIRLPPPRAIEGADAEADYIDAFAQSLAKLHFEQGVKSCINRKSR